MDWKTLFDYKTFENLQEEAKDRMQNLKSSITNWNDGGVFKTLTYIPLKAIAELYNLLLKVLPMGFVQYTSGKWLDIKVAEVGIKRHDATKTKGIIRFIKDDSNKNIKVEADTIVKTELSSQGEELRFFVDQTVISPAGESEFDVNITAEFAGAKYNVGPNYINILVTHIPGINSIYNPDGWIIQEGTDREEDDPLRERYYLKWEELSTGTTRGAYISWARQVAGVTDVEVDDQHPRGQGTVDVIIYPDSPELIDQVTSYINDKKPSIDNVLVTGPTKISVDFDIVLTLPEAYGDEQDIINQAQEIVEALFTENYTLRTTIGLMPLTIGQSLYISQITYYLMTIENVLNVKVNLPADNLIVDSKELLTKGSVNITVERAA
ncbi:MAG: hypothetical protein PWR10_1530 [Halanaerobiales bacterium]|nr:hypothetical protein [Halanaerobiales bacterium]